MDGGSGSSQRPREEARAEPPATARSRDQTVTEPIVDLWESHALPILRYVADHESEMGFVNIGQLADATGLDPNRVVVEVQRLIGDGYLPGELQMLMTGGDPRPWFLTSARLTGKGARALSIWPRAELILETIERRATEEPDPARRRALAGLAASIKDVGVGVLAEVIAAAAKKGAGLQ
jgi:hypothetical protein